MEEVIVLDQETRGVGEEGVWVEEVGWNVIEGKVEFEVVHGCC